MAGLEYADIQEALNRKDNLLALGSYTKALAVFEGRDKMVKTIQFASRFLRWHARRNGRSGETWDNMFKDAIESRKAHRLLETWTKLNKCFDTASVDNFTLDHALMLVADFSLLLLWHFDYLAHCHRRKFVHFSEADYESVRKWPGSTWLVCIAAQMWASVRKVQQAADSFTAARTELEALAASGSGSPDEIAALELQVADARAKRFAGWLNIVKCLADFNCAASMPGPQFHQRFPKTFGWLNDAVVGLSGSFSALCVIWSCIPARPAGKPKSQPTNMSERNIGAFLLALVQIGSMVNHQRTTLPTATA